MSIIMGALGGLGEAVTDIAKSNRKFWDDSELQKQQAELQAQKAMALEKFKTELASTTADSERTKMTGAIDAAKQGIVQKAIDSKYAGAVPSDATTWTPEQQAAVDQSKELDRAALMKDSKTYQQAAVETGYIDPKTAATLGQSAELTQMKLDAAMARMEDKNATMKEINEAKILAMDRSAEMRLQAAREKAASGAAEKSTLNQQLNSETQNIRATTALISTLTRQLDQATNKEQKKEIQEQIDGYRLDIEQSKGVKNLILKQLNLPTVDDLPKPKDAPALNPAAASGKADAAPAKVLTWNPKTGKFD